MRVSRGRCLLQDWLDKKGWSQADYARRTKRSKRVISHICNNESVMKPEDEYAASLIFGCKMEDLHEFTVEYDDED